MSSFAVVTEAGGAEVAASEAGATEACASEGGATEAGTSGGGATEGGTSEGGAPKAGAICKFWTSGKHLSLADPEDHDTPLGKLGATVDAGPVISGKVSPFYKRRLPRDGAAGPNGWPKIG